MTPARRRSKTASEVIPPDLVEDVARKFRALGVPSRLRILSALMDGPSSMGALVEATGLGQSNLSRQVRELELAGCVKRTNVGRSVKVEVADPNLRELCGLMCSSLER